jgi:hypothetical protein
MIEIDSGQAYYEEKKVSGTQVLNDSDAAPVGHPVACLEYC